MISQWNRGVAGGGVRNYLLNWSVLALIALTAVDFYFTAQTVFFVRHLRWGRMPSMAMLISVSVAISLVLNAVLLYLVFKWLPKLDHLKSPAVETLIKMMLSIVSIVVSVALHMYLLMIAVMPWAMKALLGSEFMLNEVGLNLTNKSVIKVLVVACIQLSYMIGKKYTSGFFFNVIAGRYRNPVTETRIIMFMDLKDSTPISEQLGHKKYFLFIRDFIHDVSNAALLHDGDIYQYVGDEVIVTWRLNETRKDSCLKVVVDARRNLQARSDYYRTKYNVVPEFRVGIHVGEISIGEIGIVKKEIAMSGEAMNITARIRSACSEYNEKHIVSEDYFAYTQLKNWQGKDLGFVSLKGIETRDLKLYGLKI